MAEYQLLIWMLDETPCCHQELVLYVYSSRLASFAFKARDPADMKESIGEPHLQVMHAT